MAHADVIVDQVNVDPVNGQRSPVSGGPTVQSAGLTDRWDPRVSVVKKKRKLALSGRKSSWASLPPRPSGPNSARSLLLLLFLYLFSPLWLTTPAHLSATPGSRVASSRSSANSSARVCLVCTEQARHAANATSRCGRGDGASAVRWRRYHAAAVRRPGERNSALART